MRRALIAYAASASLAAAPSISLAASNEPGAPFAASGIGATFSADSPTRSARRPDAKMDYGAICDGRPHPLSETYSTLAAAQVKYPLATALTNEKDWAALAMLVANWRSHISGTFNIVDELDASRLGACVINKTLDLSNIRANAASLTFAGTYLICTATGLICVDGSMNEFATWYDITINGQQSAAPMMGLYVGRNATNNRADNNKFIHPAAVGYFTLASADNFGGEVNSWDHVRFSNSAPNAYGFIADGCNHFHVVGAQGNTAFVDSQVSFYQGNYKSGEITTSGANSPPVFLCHAYSHQFDNVYTVWSGTVSPPTNVLLWSNIPANDTVAATNVSYNNTTGVLSLTFAVAPFGPTYAGVGPALHIVATMGTNATQLVGFFPITGVSAAGTVISVQAAPGLSASGLSGSVLAAGTGDESKDLAWTSHTEGGATGTLGMFGFAGQNPTQTITKLTYRDAGFGARVNDFYTAPGITSVNLVGMNYSGGNTHNGEYIFDQPSVYHASGWFDLGDETDVGRWNLPLANWSGCILLSGSPVTCNNLGGHYQPYGMNVSLGVGGVINWAAAGAISSVTVTSQAGYGANTSGTYAFPGLTVSQPDVVGGQQATAHLTDWALYTAPDAAQDGLLWPPGGVGYAVNDVLTVPGGTCPTPPQIKVTAVDGNGAIGSLGWVKLTPGSCTAAMAMPVNLTGGTGTGATLSRIGWTPNGAAIDTPGTGYLAPTFTIGDIVYNSATPPGFTSTITPAPVLINGNSIPASVTPSNGGAQYYGLFTGTVTISAAAPSQNIARCAPFETPGGLAQHLDQLAMTVSTLGTGPLAVALYSDAIDATTHRHQPQAPLWSGSFTVTAAATVTVAVGTPGVGVAVPAGLDWVCTDDGVASDAVRFPTFAGSSPFVANLIGSSAPASLTSSAANISSLIISETSGTWPSFAGATFADSAGALVPLLAARVASVP